MVTIEENLVFKEINLFDYTNPWLTIQDAREKRLDLVLPDDREPHFAVVDRFSCANLSLPSLFAQS